MKTTFKTFAFAAMMTIFGATTAFANNNNHKYNNHNTHATKVENHVHNHAPQAKGNVGHNDIMREYEMAKRCNCKNCREFVKTIDKQMRRNYTDNCNCTYCRNLNKAHRHTTNTRANVRVPASGRR